MAKDYESKVTTKLVVEGEKEYKDACKEIKTNLAGVGSEMALVTARYKDNAESSEALTAKQDVLKKKYAEQERQVQETQKQIERLTRAEGDHTEQIGKLERSLNYQQAALYKTTSEIRSTETAMDRLSESTLSLEKDTEKLEDSTVDLSQAADGAKTSFDGLGNMLGSVAGITATTGAAMGAAITAGLGIAVSKADGAKGALNDFAASTGVTGWQVEAFGEIMKGIYNNNFGEGFEDIAASMAEVKRNSNIVDPEEIGRVTEYALALRDTFGYEIQEQMRAATQLVEHFGLSNQEAFNLMANGAQSGLDKNGDMLDSINEYAVHYEQLGMTAQEMFSSLANSAENGVFSIDKAGDAIKEFGIRVKDGSDTTADAFVSIGVNTGEMQQAFLEGGEAAKDAFQEVTKALLDMDDPMAQNTAGVALFGTMWEDLGKEGVAGLADITGGIHTAKESLDQINQVKYDTFGEAMQGAGRLIQTSFVMPIGEEALPIFNDFATALSEGAKTAEGDMGKLASSFGDAMAGLTAGLGELIPQITSVLGEVVNGILQGIVSSAPAIIQAGSSMLIDLVKGMNESIPRMVEATTTIIITLVDGLTEGIPLLLDGATEMMLQFGQGLIEALPELLGKVTEIVEYLVEMLIENAPLMYNAVFGIMLEFAKGISEAIPRLLPEIVELVIVIAETIISNVPMLIGAALAIMEGLVSGLVEALPVLMEVLPVLIETIITAIIESLPIIAESAGRIIKTLSDGLLNSLPLIMESIPEIIETIIVGIVKELPTILLAAGEIVLAIAQGIIVALPHIVLMGPRIIIAVIEGIVGALGGIVEIGVDILKELWNGISSWFGNLTSNTPEIITTIVNALSGALGSVVDIGKNIVEGIWEGISGAGTWLWEKITGWADGILSTIQSAFDINSPSGVMRDGVGIYLAQGVGVGFEEEMPSISQQMAKAIPSEFMIDPKVGVQAKGGLQSLETKSGASSGTSKSIQIIQHIHAKDTSYAGQQREAAKQFKMIARSV